MGKKKKVINSQNTGNSRQKFHYIVISEENYTVQISQLCIEGEDSRIGAL